MRSRRPRTALVFIAMGMVLLAAIAVGQKIGEQAIFGTTQRRVPVAGPLATPVPDATPSGEPGVSLNWKRLQVVSVATDPAFPDPRVTPPPTPRPPTPKPTNSPTPVPDLIPSGVYTSPPLPIPIASHDPNETPEPIPNVP